MQINSINQNNQYNNPNFKKLYASKRTLNEIGHTKKSLLESNAELRKLSQLFDVKVNSLYSDYAKKYNDHYRQDLAAEYAIKSLSVLSGIGLVAVLIKEYFSGFTPVGLGFLASLGCYKAAFEGLSRIKFAPSDHMKSYNAEICDKSLRGNQNLNVKLTPEDLNDRFNLSVKKDFALLSSNSYLLFDRLKKKDEEGNNPLHGMIHISPGTLEKMLENPTIFKNVLTEKNNKGETPLMTLPIDIVLDVLEKNIGKFKAGELENLLLEKNDTSGISLAESLFKNHEFSSVSNFFRRNVENPSVLDLEKEYIKKIIESPREKNNVHPIFVMNMKSIKEMINRLSSLHCHDYETLNKLLLLENNEFKTLAEVCLNNPETNALIKKLSVIMDKEGYKDLKNIVSDYYDREIISNIRNNYSKEEISKMIKAFMSQIENSNLYDANEIFNLIKSPIVRLTQGAILTTEYNNAEEPLLFNIADILPTEENKPILKKILSILNSCNKIDYTKKDKIGFTFLEKIIFTENELLLNWATQKSWQYSPNLDILYKELKNVNIKNILDNLKIEFPDMINAVKLKSLTTLSMLYSQFESPFYDKNVQGQELLEMIKTFDRNTFNNFSIELKKYLPE